MTDESVPGDVTGDVTGGVTDDGGTNDPTSLTLRIVAHSEVGLVRKNNQDSGYASPQLLLVADGMGGAAAGDLASAVAVDTIRAIDGPVDADTKLHDLAAAIERANDRIAELIRADYTLEGMGTTVTGALFDGRQLGLAHIGDSRAYLFRGDRLERLTHDHSWVQSLVDDGKISLAEAAVHPHRSLLLKVLNGAPATEPDLTTVPLEAGDRLLFCSDGLCGLVDDDEITEALRRGPLDDALDLLVDGALSAGGIDNVTVVLADVFALDAAPEQLAYPPVLGAAADQDVTAAILSAQAVGAARRHEQEDEDDEDDDDPPARTPEPDEARYLPQAPSRGRFRRPLIAVLVLVLVVGAGLGAGYAWSRTQYFVGASVGQVAIFRGVADPVPEVSLSEVYEVQRIDVADLPAYYQRMVQGGIAVADLAGARTTVAELDQEARRCRRERGQPGSTAPSGTAAPSTSDSPSPAPTATPRSATPGSATPRSTTPRSTTGSVTGSATPGGSTSPGGSGSSGTATSAVPSGEACR